MSQSSPVSSGTIVQPASPSRASTMRTRAGIASATHRATCLTMDEQTESLFMARSCTRKRASLRSLERVRRSWLKAEEMPKARVSEMVWSISRSSSTNAWCSCHPKTSTALTRSSENTGAPTMLEQEVESSERTLKRVPASSRIMQASSMRPGRSSTLRHVRARVRATSGGMPGVVRAKSATSVALTA